MKRFLSALAVLATACIGLQAQPWSYQKRVFTSSDGLEIPYQIHIPETVDPVHGNPLLLFLHGAGERGVDGDLQMIHGGELFRTDPLLKDVIVIAPQCPDWDQWSGHIDTGRGDIFPDKPVVSLSQQAVWEILDSFVKTGLADPDRVYATGLSMGGMGVLDMALSRPDYFAAVQPMCGGISDVAIKKWDGITSFRFFHGTADDDVLYEYSVNAVRLLKARGAEASLVSYPGCGHGCWDYAFAEPDFLSWMLNRTRRDNVLRVMSFNMRYGTAPDGDNAWPNRAPATPAMLEEECPDVFGVQEAMSFQLETITSALSRYSCVGVGREDGKNGGEHMSVFYDNTKFTLLDWGTFWLSETPDKPSKGWDGQCTRTATWTKLRRNADGREFFFVNTHLDHVGEQARIKGVELILERIAAMNTGGLPAILTGDLNSTPDAPCLEPLLLKMRSARDCAAVSDSRTSTNDYKVEKGVQIDYVCVSGVSRVLTFEVLRNSYAGVPYISDHYPVVSDLVL